METLKPLKNTVFLTNSTSIYSKHFQNNIYIYITVILLTNMLTFVVNEYIKKKQSNLSLYMHGICTLLSKFQSSVTKLCAINYYLSTQFFYTFFSKNYHIQCNSSFIQLYFHSTTITFSKSFYRYQKDQTDIRKDKTRCICD